MNRLALITVAALLFASTTLAAQTNPVPLVNNPVIPGSALPGGASFTLTVNGTGFVVGSTVDWNGAPLQTTFVSGAQLTATVPASNIAAAGTASVSVVSPAPGGGMSNAAWFEVRKPFPAVSFGETEIPLGTSSSGPIEADFNRDGKLDIALVVGNDMAISILLGNGDGTFQRAVEYPLTVHPGLLVTGDFNGDGTLDVATFFSGAAVVLPGNGDGTFQSPVYTPSSLFNLGLATADFNGDGKLDLAVTTTTPAGQLAVALGNGDGSFQTPTLYPVALLAEFVAIGDFNGDGRLDLAVAGGGQGGIVAVFLGNGDGTFQTALDNDVEGAEDVVTGDFNGDGKLDLAVKTGFNSFVGGISLLLGNGDGSFQAAIDSPSTPDTLMTTADLNGDGKLDLIVPTFEKVQVLLGTGNGQLGSPGFFPTAKFAGGVVSTGDFNGDGLLDLIVPNGDNELLVLPQVTSVLSETLTYFGSVKLGKSKTLQVTLMNYGDTRLSIDRIGVQGDDASVFSETNDCGSGVLPGRSCKIAITFTPQAPHIYTQARVAIRDSATRLSQKIMLEGMGLK